ncbi:MAG: XRE family transcriptional regulator [Deltaproteobacteria bacterium]|nr:XRE family transcriptional regulator [Deltaproteobacteria bacterium]
MAQDKEAASAVEELEIGRKIRTLREKQRFTLEDLAAKTALPKTLLADIENGDFVPPVATLLNLARALGVGMGHFFKDEAPGVRISLTRSNERVPIRKRPHHREGEVDYVYEALETRKSGKHMEPLLVEFQPSETADMVFTSHEGEEFAYLLEGRLEFRTDNRVEVLDPGDTIYFESDLNHSFRSLDGKPAKALVVVWNRT